MVVVFVATHVAWIGEEEDGWMWVIGVAMYYSVRLIIFLFP